MLLDLKLIRLDGIKPNHINQLLLILKVKYVVFHIISNFKKKKILSRVTDLSFSRDFLFMQHELVRLSFPELKKRSAQKYLISQSLCTLMKFIVS